MNFISYYFNGLTRIYTAMRLDCYIKFSYIVKNFYGYAKA